MTTCKRNIQIVVDFSSDFSAQFSSANETTRNQKLFAEDFKNRWMVSSPPSPPCADHRSLLIPSFLPSPAAAMLFVYSEACADKCHHFHPWLLSQVILSSSSFMLKRINDTLGHAVISHAEAKSGGAVPRGSLNQCAHWALGLEGLGSEVHLSNKR